MKEHPPTPPSAGQTLPPGAEPVLPAATPPDAVRSAPSPEPSKGSGILNLSGRQQATVATAVTVFSAFVIVVAVAALLYLIGLFFATFSNVFLPVAVAAVLALVLKPYYDWLRDRLRLHNVGALLVLFISLLIPVAALGWFFGAILAEQIGDLVERAPTLWANMTAYLEEKWPRVVALWESDPWGQRLQEVVEGQQAGFMEGLQTFTGQALSAGFGFFRIIGNLLGWVVLPIYLAFFLMTPEVKVSGRDFLPFLKPETRDDVMYLGREFVNILVAFFRGQLLIALCQGALFALGFSIVGLRYGLIIGLMLGFLNIIPYLGSIVGLAVALPLAFFQEGGGLLTVGLVLVVFTVVQCIEGYILTPQIMGNTTGLHPMAIIIAIFFWGTALNGIAGMILAIPLTAFLTVFWRLAREKYIGELV